MSYGGRIAILPGQSKAEEFSTLVHELAHEMLHKAERRTATTKTVRETEAEAIAFVVGKAVGLETGTASADYIHLYHGNASLLAESLEVIQQTSAVILAALQPSAARDDARCRTGEGGVMKTILRILERAGGYRPTLYLKIENPPYMALVIEATPEPGPLGSAAISVAHYGEQNGDLMRDPEMCFELRNRRYAAWSLWPTTGATITWASSSIPAISTEPITSLFPTSTNSTGSLPRCGTGTSTLRAFSKRLRTSRFVASPLPWSGYR